MDNSKQTNETKACQTATVACQTHFHFSKSEELVYYARLRKQIIKLLFLIEEEQKGNASIDAWFYGFMFELASSNSLCSNKLTAIIVKINGLFENSHYKTMTHSQIKKQIMESRGMIDYLIQETQQAINTATYKQQHN